MTIHTTHCSSRSEERPTPANFFARLDREFGFTLDRCATRFNAKFRWVFTRATDGLKQDWSTHKVFCNPLYGRQMRDCAWKCHAASDAGALVVLLAHARTDTHWFHDHVYGKAELRFIRDRLKFGEAATSAPFPSLVAIYRPPPGAVFSSRHLSTLSGVAA